MAVCTRDEAKSREKPVVADMKKKVTSFFHVDLRVFLLVRICFPTKGPLP